jgi:phosphoglycolate phosphatase
VRDDGFGVLFDLDGTLTDPFLGITRSIDHAMARLGRPAPAAEELRWCIGPPLKTSFAVLLESEDPTLLDAAVGHYRERYAAVGKFENRLIDGIPAALSELRARGASLWVATSKLETYAAEIVAHFGLMPHFGGVHGSQADGRNSSKAELIGHILASEGLDPTRCVMVGDRSHDVAGAAAHGIPTVGVGWGYAAPGELEAAGAAAIATSPGEVPGLIAAALRGGRPS